MLIVIAVLAVPTAIAIWLTERIDRPRRREMRLAELSKAKQSLG
jgi:hypothetical protein